jgi:hypothetical protein
MESAAISEKVLNLWTPCRSPGCPHDEDLKTVRHYSSLREKRSSLWQVAFYFPDGRAQAQRKTSIPAIICAVGLPVVFYPAGTACNSSSKPIISLYCVTIFCFWGLMCTAPTSNAANY